MGSILTLAVVSTAVYLTLATGGDLRQRPALVLVGVSVLLLAMGATWIVLRGRPGGFGWMLVAALVFRLVSAWGEPALSDDIHRYVWDGRVQAHGVHPYSYAPDDPAIESLRDSSWQKINHRQIKTVYPPLSQMLFLMLAAVGADAFGFRIALGLIDFGVVLALLQLLRVLGLPRDRATLYAWNPLAVLESSGSGHIEPLGVGLLIVATVWIIDRRPRLSTAPLAAAIHVKLVPLVVLPVFFKRYGWADRFRLAAWFLLLWLPYAVTGPLVGAGLWAYAGSWEYNASIFGVVRRALLALDTGRRFEPLISWLKNATQADWVPWDTLYAGVWPHMLARGLVAAALLVWLALVVRRPALNAAQQAFLILAALLALSPTVHPWYVLWVLPFAALFLSWPWLVFAATVFLSYLGGSAEPPAWVPLVEYGLLYGGLAMMLWRKRALRGAVR